MSGKADTEILQRSVIPAGRVIFHANDVGTTAFLINKGTVEIYREENGREANIAMLERPRPGW